MSNKLPYRKGVNVIIVDANQAFLVVQLVDYLDSQWKFLGGGVEAGESDLEAVYREIKEEIGIDKNALTLVGLSQVVEKYDFPSTLKNEISSKYRGQEKHQFVFVFHGEKSELVLQKEEIKAAKWILQEDFVQNLIFPNQLENAMKIMDEFNLKLN